MPAQNSLRGLSVSFVWRSKMSKTTFLKPQKVVIPVIPVNFWKLQCTPSMLLSDMTLLMTPTDASTFGLLVLIGCEIFLLLQRLISRKWALTVSNRMNVSLSLVGHDVTLQEDLRSDLSIHLHVFR